MKDFSTTTQSITGVQVRHIRYSEIGKCWIGQVWDETALRPDKWTSCSWSKTGKNKTRPEFNLS